MEIDEQYNFVSLSFAKFSFSISVFIFCGGFCKTVINLKSGGIISPYLILTTNNPFFSK